MKINDLIKIIGWELINPFVLKRKRNKIYDFPSTLSGINIGCGIHNPSNWLGVDGGFTHYLIHKIPKGMYKLFFSGQKMVTNYTFDEYYKLSKSIQLVHHELKYGLPFKDNSIPNIYSSHFLEHLFRADAKKLLEHCYRVLARGGTMRICVPSIEYEIDCMQEAIEKYKTKNSDDIQQFITSDTVGFNSVYSDHRYMYDYKRLSEVLNDIGFINLRECKYREGDLPDVTIIDTREGLIIECSK